MLDRRTRTVTRFAPSPTGPLHLGHAYAALFAARSARRSGGRFLLRIEDIDPGRCRPEHVSALLDDVAWLGLAWDGPVRVQSHHLTEYRASLGRLTAADLLYPCFCTRAAIAREIAASGAAPHGLDGPRYPGTCRGLAPAERARRIAAGEPHALRLDLAVAVGRAGSLRVHDLDTGERACDPTPFGDVVLARKDGWPSYHLAATHDDAAQGVTVVTRGEDLAPAADLHRLLQALLGWPAPAYLHHKLLTGTDGRRLSKRDGAPSIAALRAAGHTPEAVRAMAGFPDP